MSALIPFTPKPGSNQFFTLAAAGTQVVSIEETNNSIRFANSGANPVHFRTYSSKDPTPPVASVADCVVLANFAGVFTKSLRHDRVSIFSTAGTTVHVCTGEGF